MKSTGKLKLSNCCGLPSDNECKLKIQGKDLIKQAIKLMAALHRGPRRSRLEYLNSRVPSC